MQNPTGTDEYDTSCRRAQVGAEYAGDNGASLPRHPVQWWQGMLLAPEHFQQNHVYWEQQVLKLRTHLQPHYWGVVELRIDDGALVEGRVRIIRLQAVMPDGLIIDHDERIEPGLEIDLAKEETGRNNQCAVQLTAPIRTEAPACPSGLIQRFDSIRGGMPADENTGEKSVAIQRLRPRLELTAVPTDSRYLALPLLKVVKDKDGAYRLADYMPPLLYARGADFLKSRSLTAILRRMLAGIRGKAVQLADLAAGQAHGSGGSGYFPRQFQTRCLIAELPQMELLVENPRSHPFDLYMGLARLLGHISQLSEKSIPPPMKKYNHNDIAPGFIMVCDYVEQQVGRIRLAYASTPFTLEKNRDFSILPDQAWLPGPWTIHLKGHPNQKRRDLVEWLTHCRIASAGYMEKLETLRLPGLPREILERDAELQGGAAPRGLLARITLDKRFLKPGQKLVIACAHEKARAKRPRAVELLAPPRRRRGARARAVNPLKRRVLQTKADKKESDRE